jgi:hypothetical protein
MATEESRKQNLKQQISSINDRIKNGKLTKEQEKAY